MESVLTETPEGHWDYRYWLRGESTNNDEALRLTLDGDGVALLPGVKGDFYIPYDCYVLGWALLSQTAATATVDVWSTAAADFPPDDLDSITGGAPMALAGGTSSEGWDVTAWERFIPAGNIIRFVLENATDVFYLNIVLILNRPGVLTQDLPGLETKADLVHTHDDRYYTETEVDALMQTISGTHDHDDRYYTESEMDALLLSHSHDDIYYIKPEIDSYLSAKAATVHSHDASAITTGTIDVARVPDLDAAKITGGAFPEARIPILTAAKIPNLDAAKIATGEFGVARIPSMDAAKITTGVFPEARIPNISAAKITAGTIALARIPAMDNDHIPDLAASRITSGTFTEARMPTPKPANTYYNASSALTTYSSAPGTYQTVYSTNITGLRGLEAYVVDAYASMDGYGDSGGVGEFQIWVLIGATEESTPTLQMDQGVDSMRSFRLTTVATSDSGGNIAIRFRHRQMSGVYTLRFQQFSVMVVAQVVYG